MFQHGNRPLALALGFLTLSLLGSSVVISSRLNAEVSASELPRFAVQHHHGSGKDWVPDVVYVPTKTALSDGNWSNPAVWGGILPANDDRVLIPAGKTVTYDVISDAHVKAIGVKGTLKFADNLSTRLRVETIMAYAGSTVEVGTKAKPIQPHVKSEIIFDGTVNLAEDPAQFTVGMVAIDAVIRVQGADVTYHYSHLSKNFNAGEKIITVQDPVDWKAGDRLYFADTQLGVVTQDPDFVRQGEHETIASINGKQITLQMPLQYPHEGYIAQLSRNVVFRSATPEASPIVPTTGKNRGHIIFLGKSDVIFDNAELKDLGRTMANEEGNPSNNKKYVPLNDTKFDANGKVISIGTNLRGRYPLHAHHLQKAVHIEGNVVDTGRKWGITLHNGYGKILNNVLVEVDGAGIVAEDGNEYGLIEGNIVIGNGGGSGIHDDANNSAGRKNKDFGHGGFGFWFQSPLVRVEKNIAAGNFRVEGFGYFLFEGYPNHLSYVENVDPADIAGIDKGILPVELGGLGKTYEHQYTPILPFKDNTADVLGSGLGIWNTNAAYGQNIVDNFHAKIRAYKHSLLFANGVNVFYSAPKQYQRDKGIEIRNSVILGPFALGLDPEKLPARGSDWGIYGPIGIDGNPGGATQYYRVVNTRVEGFDVGLRSGSCGVDVLNSTLKNFRNIQISEAKAPNCKAHIENVDFEGISSSKVKHDNILLDDRKSADDAARMVEQNDIVALKNWTHFRTDIRVLNYDKTDEDFALFYATQDPDYVIPMLNMANRDAWSKLGIAIGNDQPVSPRAKPLINAIVGDIAPVVPTVWADQAQSGAENFELTYNIDLDPSDGVPREIKKETITGLKPGFNLITRMIDFGGKKYIRSFPVWGTFATGNRAPYFDDAPVGIMNKSDIDGTVSGIQIRPGKTDFRVVARDNDPDTLTWKWTVNEEGRMPREFAAGSFTPPTYGTRVPTRTDAAISTSVDLNPAEATHYTLTVTVSDGMHSISKDLEFDVVPVNQTLSSSSKTSSRSSSISSSVSSKSSYTSSSVSSKAPYSSASSVGSKNSYSSATSISSSLKPAAPSSAVPSPSIPVSSAPAYVPGPPIFLEPADQSEIYGSSIRVRYYPHGGAASALPKGAAGIVIFLSNQAHVADADFDGEFTISNVAPGAHSVNAYFVNAAGERLTSFRTHIVIVKAQPAASSSASSVSSPTSSAPATTTVDIGADRSANVNETINLTSAVTHNGQINPAGLQYQWDISGPADAQYFHLGLLSRQLLVTFITKGTYTVTLTVKDGTAVLAKDQFTLTVPRP